jgi:hypothetical protein
MNGAPNIDLERLYQPDLQRQVDALLILLCPRGPGSDHKPTTDEDQSSVVEMKGARQDTPSRDSNTPTPPATPRQTNGPR